MERWKSIKRDGFLRDKKRQNYSIIMFKRNTIDMNKDISIDKLDNNPHIFYTFEKNILGKTYMIS